jgi:hypothetical protein
MKRLAPVFLILLSFNAWGEKYCPAVEELVINSDGIVVAPPGWQARQYESIPESDKLHFLDAYWGDRQSTFSPVRCYYYGDSRPGMHIQVESIDTYDYWSFLAHSDAWHQRISEGDSYFVCDHSYTGVPGCPFD